jgi:hypothetical protein
MSIPTDDTQRTKILAAIQAAVQALPWAGRVSEVLDESETAAAFAAGKCVVEWGVESDRSVRGEGVDAGWTIEQLRFAVLFNVLIPPAAYGTTSPAIVASRLYASLVTTMTGPTGPSEGGVWPDGGGAGLALHTELLGGGACGFIDERQDVAMTEASFVVTYRHALGQP